METLLIGLIVVGGTLFVPFFLLVFTLLTGFGPLWWKNCNARFIRLFKNKKRPFEYSLIDGFVILGSLPRKQSHLDELKTKHNVAGIVTLNMPWELVVKPKDITDSGLESLLISTPDYCAPTLENCMKGVAFMETIKSQNPASRVYVHCNAGKGRSTTVVLCFLLKSKKWTYDQAFEYVKKKRPHIANLRALCGTRPQWQVVKEFYRTTVQPPTNNARKVWPKKSEE